ncbi:hypothetical protein AK84_10245 [Streptococcus pneumoniae K2557]|nr:hypothetical protein AK84_10245 [Streptococcus pneumoniae K2557]
MNTCRCEGDTVFVIFNFFWIPINIEITYLSIDGLVLVVTFQFINQKCDGFIVYETASKIKKNLSSKFFYARLVKIKL